MTAHIILMLPKISDMGVLNFTFLYNKFMQRGVGCLNAWFDIDETLFLVTDLIFLGIHKIVETKLH